MTNYVSIDAAGAVLVMCTRCGCVVPKDCTDIHDRAHRNRKPTRQVYGEGTDMETHVFGGDA